MNLFLLIQIIFVALNLIESRHDYYVIKLQNYQAIDFEKLRTRWKFWSSAYYLIVICVAVIIGHLLFQNIWHKMMAVAALLANREIFFELPESLQLYGLNKIFYVDKSSKTNIIVSQIFGKLIGKNLGVFKFLVSVTIIILVNLFV